MSPRPALLLLGLLGLLAACATTPVPGTFPDHWIDGTDPAEPAFQVHAYEPATLVLRQSVRTDFEAPFLYLFLGEERALLLDTGAGGWPAGEGVAAVVARELAARGRGTDELLVLHTHGHGDHVRGDAELAALPGATVVPADREAVVAALGFTDWPRDAVTLDLGGRVLDVLAIPGHHPAHLAFHDRRTGLLVTGDSLYPGRLYVAEGEAWDAYRASVERLAAFAASRAVTWVLGTHIELTATPGVDYAARAATHPDERRLELEPRHLDELLELVRALGDTPARTVRDDFILWPLRPRAR